MGKNNLAALNENELGAILTNILDRVRKILTQTSVLAS